MKQNDVGGVDALRDMVKRMERELQACQAVIHLAVGFDPAYVNDAQAVLKDARALLASPAAVGWLPIETAPKDGARILLFLPNQLGDSVWTGLWAEGWHVSYGKAEREPTHWMPLPSPPAIASQEVGNE